MALMREAEVWAEGAASSGGYSGVAEVSMRGGADGSLKEGPDIWNSEELEKSWKERPCGEKEEQVPRSVSH